MTNQEKTELEIKSVLYQQCIDFVEQRLQTIQNSIKEIQVSLTSETKSSAGDKHETGRAMLQLERENAGRQLSEIEKLKESVSKIDINYTSNTIGLGSVIITSQANYFMAISCGKLQINSNEYFAISPETPIGQLLFGKKAEDVIHFRDSKFKILNVS